MDRHCPRRQPVSPGERRQLSENYVVARRQCSHCIARWRYPDSLLGHGQMEKNAVGTSVLFVQIRRWRLEPLFNRERSKSPPSFSRPPLYPGSRHGSQGQHRAGWRLFRIQRDSTVLPAERVSDDIPASRAMQAKGLLSPLWTLDVKSFPPPTGDLINRGELGTPDSPSDKRKYVELHGDFDNLLAD